MIFSPQKYSIEDHKSLPFIDHEEIVHLLAQAQNPTSEQVREVVDASLSLKRLTLAQTAILLQSQGEDNRQIIIDAARKLKREVYGERIVLFAPLYIGNHCSNNCTYCGFRAGNKQAIRHTLSDEQIKEEVSCLERVGQKRLILVYGEHPQYNAQYIADNVRLVYSIIEDDHSNNRINRVNINAAPFDVDGFRTIQQAGIGTYQIFQESYDPKVYSHFHPTGRKSDYNYRLTALDRAMEAGIDDVGLGVLFGLGDWRFEVMGLVRHTNHLEACFKVGPHTISFPRIRRASGLDSNEINSVDDEDFALLIAILRLAVPYAGLILTAREPVHLRNKLLEYGVSQIDAGTRLEIAGYTGSSDNHTQNLDREQFELSDQRSLEQTIRQLVEDDHIPSFCTACYRKCRTGEHFMEFSTSGFIKQLCTPNALLSFAEYLQDYATEGLQAAGWQLIDKKVAEINDPKSREKMDDDLQRIKKGERDILY